MSPPRSPTGSGHHNPKALTDLSTDAFALCTRLLSLRDISNLAMSSKSLRLLAYSDAVWFRLLQYQTNPSSIRYLYSQFLLVFYDGQCLGLIGIDGQIIACLLELEELGKSIYRDSLQCGSLNSVILTLFIYGLCLFHRRKFCWLKMRSGSTRLFPISETSFFRSEMQRDDTILATSSSDRTIRLWWKGSPQRCFKGHSGPVTVLADTLLGDCGSKFLVSGGEDSTVRLWSVGSGRMHGHPAVTYHGHEKSISFLSVARHKASLLVSLAKDSRVRLSYADYRIC